MNTNIVILTAFLSNQMIESNRESNKGLKRILKENGFNRVANCKGGLNAEVQEGIIVAVRRPNDVTKLLDFADFYSQETILYVDELGQAYLIGYDNGTRFDQCIGSYEQITALEANESESYTHFDGKYYGVINDNQN